LFVYIIIKDLMVLKAKAVYV